MKKHLKILYIGNGQGFGDGSKYYLIPQKLINGFTRLGHTVFTFSDKDFSRYSNILRSQKFGVSAMNAKVVSLAKEYQPDLIVLGHCKYVSNETLQACRDSVSGLKIIYRNVDPLHSKSNVKDIKQRVGYVDGMFITTAGSPLKQFSSKGGFVSFMPNPVDPSLETSRAYANVNADIDFLFLASVLRDQKDHRAITARRLVDDLSTHMKLHIGGAGINKNRIFGSGFHDVLARSKMGLCMNKTEDYYLYASDRMSQYMGSGLLAFIPKGPQFEDVFGDDCFISVDDNDDLIDKIKKYHKDDKARIKIAKKGCLRIHDIFHHEKICSYMLETVFQEKHSQDYRWPTTLY